MKTTVKRIGAVAATIARGVAIALLAALLSVNLYRIIAQNVFHTPCPTVLGYYNAVVLSGSMSGAIEVDDLVITHREADYTVGDIITFQSGGSTVTHRIAALEDGGYRTKGDANNAADPGDPVAPEAVIGRVVCVIPRIGAVIRFFSTPFGMLCLLGGAFLLLEAPARIGRQRTKSTNN